MKPLTDGWYSVEGFDCYAKKVLKYATYDHYRAEKKRLEHETRFSEMSESELSKLATTDSYSECDDCFSINGLEVKVNDFDIAEALWKLPLCKRKIILLYYFIGLTDNEIAERMALPESTVQYRRTAALDKLRKILEDSFYG